MTFRPDLFSLLAQQLQSADVLASHRVFMVLFRTLKELSTKRLAVDQRNYAEITSHLFEYTWNLWKSDVQTILQNLSMLSQRSDIDSILEQSNDLMLICDRWLLCLKIIRQLIFSGYASDSTTAQVVIISILIISFAHSFIVLQSSSTGPESKSANQLLCSVGSLAG
jgi:hypothetical protein